MATDISECSVAGLKSTGLTGGGRAEAGQGAGRAHGCSYTAKAGRSSAMVPGELARTVAPSGNEVRGFGIAVTTVTGMSGA